MHLHISLIGVVFRLSLRIKCNFVTTMWRGRLRACTRTDGQKFRHSFG